MIASWKWTLGAKPKASNIYSLLCVAEKKFIDTVVHLARGEVKAKRPNLDLGAQLQ